jgi:methylmalonyl-CoA/ethylmalonyl-CoA epimerase
MVASDGMAARFIDHVGILVADADAAAGLFASRFGLEVVNDEVVDDRGVRLMFLAASDRSLAATIQLVQPLRPGPMKQQLDEHGEGVHHVCLAVADLDATLEALHEDPSGIFTGGRGRRCCFLGEKASGSLIELAEVGLTS